MESFEVALTEGKINSLGRTEDVVTAVLADKSRLDQLFACYSSDDEWVRLRTSSALKRVARAEPTWIVPFLDRLLTEVADIDQASAQWTLAELFATLEQLMSPEQKASAIRIMQRNLSHSDWIVLNQTMATLAAWAVTDEDLRRWLLPRLHELQHDGRRSVANRASKLTATL